MGLDSYIFSCPRMGNVTPINIMAMRDLFEYEKIDEKYKTENYYPTAEKYFVSQSAYTLDDLPQNKKLINDYRKQYFSNGDIIENVLHWRNNRDIHKYFVTHFQKQDDCRVGEEIYQADLIGFLLYLNERLENKYELGYLSRAYRYGENNDIVSIPCDGVEIQCDDGTINRLDGETFFSIKDIYKEEFIEILNTIGETIKILGNTSFDKKMLFYVSSW